MSNHKNPKQQTGGRQPIDPLLAQRLEQLGGRRPTGSPLPPPTPGTAAWSDGARSQVATKQAPPRPAARQQSSAKPQHVAVISTEPPSKRIRIQGTHAGQTEKLQAAAARAAAARATKGGGGVNRGKAVPPTGRKNKPATASKIASLAVSIATTAALAGLFARNDSSTQTVTLTGGTAAGNGTANGTGNGTANGNVAGTGTGATQSSVATGPAGATPTPTVAAGAARTIKDGTYVGKTEYNRFGAVQVQAVYGGGKLTDVQILQYEDGDNRSIRINQIALPRLIQRAVAAQGTQIDGVSGATYTTRSYVKTLQSAIDAAKQASGITG